MISVAQPSTFKWHFHFSSNFIDFSIFCTHACLFCVITTTWGCHPLHQLATYPSTTSWPCAMPIPLSHHPGQPQGRFLCTHAPILGITTHSQSISIDISTHPWLGSR